MDGAGAGGAAAGVHGWLVGWLAGGWLVGWWLVVCGARVQECCAGLEYRQRVRAGEQASERAVYVVGAQASAGGCRAIVGKSEDGAGLEYIRLWRAWPHGRRATVVHACVCLGVSGRVGLRVLARVARAILKRASAGGTALTISRAATRLVGPACGAGLWGRPVVGSDAQVQIAD
ncbi:hypothetical protein BC831DRAFT_66552 [Entophlyctis helioformis]|nr:hypothetical protein BC831DRAFT_66552 [Entophlyctis helioformis]